VGKASDLGKNMAELEIHLVSFNSPHFLFPFVLPVI